MGGQPGWKVGMWICGGMAWPGVAHFPGAARRRQGRGARLWRVRRRLLLGCHAGQRCAAATACPEGGYLVLAPTPRQGRPAHVNAGLFRGAAGHAPWPPHRLRWPRRNAIRLQSAPLTACATFRPRCRRCRREYARALAVLASKAPHPAWTAFLGRCVQEASMEEDTFHKARRRLWRG